MKCPDCGHRLSLRIQDLNFGGLKEGEARRHWKCGSCGGKYKDVCRIVDGRVGVVIQPLREED